MRIAARLLALFSLSLFPALLFVVTPAEAQATRTWVSGLGDDANPCSYGTMQDLRWHQRLHPAGGAAYNIFANRIVSVNNGTGYQADGSGAGVLLNNAVATANSTGMSAVNSGLTFTCKNNAINGNLSSDETPTNQIPPEMNGGGARPANSARRSLFDHARTPSGPYLLPLEQHVA